MKLDKSILERLIKEEISRLASIGERLHASQSKT